VDHFVDTTPDEDWLEEVGRRGWTALTHNSRIRYQPNQLNAVMSHRVALLVIVGKATHADLARSFVNTLPRINDFLEERTPPFIAKVYRPSPSELERSSMAKGRVELWHPK
jgi:hypothetical protein